MKSLSADNISPLVRVVPTLRKKDGNEWDRGRELVFYLCFEEIKCELFEQFCSKKLKKGDHNQRFYNGLFTISKHHCEGGVKKW